MTTKNPRKLTKKEMEICSSIFDCPRIHELADKFCCTELTIKTHLNSIYKKLNIHSRGELVAIVARNEIEKEQQKTAYFKTWVRYLAHEVLQIPPLKTFDEKYYFGKIKETILKREYLIKRLAEKIKGQQHENEY